MSNICVSFNNIPSSQIFSLLEVYQRKRCREVGRWMELTQLSGQWSCIIPLGCTARQY
jgi:hypothetical protein